MSARGPPRRPGRGQLRDRFRRPQRDLPGAGPADRRAGARQPAAISRRCAEAGRRPPAGRSPTEIAQAIAVIGENMNLRRTRLSRGRRRAWSARYLHSQLAPGLGKIGVLVALRSAGDAGAARRARQAGGDARRGRQPPGRERRPSSTRPGRARARDLRRAGARQPASPTSIIEKMVEGRMRKFYEEVVLLEQAFVDRPRQPGQGARSRRLAKELGTPVVVTGFVRLALGEGIESRSRRTSRPRWRSSPAPEVGWRRPDPGPGPA